MLAKVKNHAAPLAGAPITKPKTRKRARRKPRDESFLRTFRVDRIELSVGIRVDHRRGQSPSLDAHSWLELHARFDEPIQGIYEATINVYPDPNADVAPGPPPCVGSIIQMKPHLQVVVSYPINEFDRLWAIAIASGVRTGHVAFTAPHRGRALVVSLGFGTVDTPEE